MEEDRIRICNFSLLFFVCSSSSSHFGLIIVTLVGSVQVKLKTNSKININTRKTNSGGMYQTEINLN